ncbi:MAG: hypothetical protein ACI39F_05995 [Acutalibacteraceae bacterium]
MKSEIQNCLSWLVNGLATAYVYDSWGDKMKVREMKEKFDMFYKQFKDKNLIDFNNLTISEAKELRFGKWDENSDLWLIPLWLYPLIPIGTKLTSISGNEIIFDGKNIDKDIRFGCLAWGIELKERKDEN